MLIVNADIKRDQQQKGAALNTIFDENNVKYSRIQMGTVIIPPGSRVPLEGVSAHEQDEFGYVLKGTITISTGGKEYIVSAGQATYLPKNQEHWSFNHGEEECEIIWFLVEN